MDVPEPPEGTRGPGARRAALAGLLAVGALALLVSARSFICGLAGEASWCRSWPYLPFDQLDDVIRGFGPWGAAASIGLMILHSFVPFPAELLAMANGAVFGPVAGAALTWAGAMLGAFLAFGLSRTFGRPLVLRVLFPAHGRALDAWVERLGTDLLLLGRFIPVISFNLMNYAAGLTAVSWWTFAWTTGVGILPLSVLMAVLGHRFDAGSWRFWLLAAASAVVVWLPAHLVLRARRRHRGGNGGGTTARGSAP